MNWDIAFATIKTSGRQTIMVANCAGRRRWIALKRRKVDQGYDQPFAHLKLPLDSISEGHLIGSCTLTG